VLEHLRQEREDHGEAHDVDEDRQEDQAEHALASWLHDSG
jgi:hypothetical protein